MKQHKKTALAVFGVTFARFADSLHQLPRTGRRLYWRISTPLVYNNPAAVSRGILNDI